MMYSEVNRDCSGYISEQEVRLIIAKIGIFVPRAELHNMFLDRDVERVNQLAFNEFIDLVVYLLSRNGNAELSLVLQTFLDLERDHNRAVDLESIDGDGNSSVCGYFSQEDQRDDQDYPKKRVHFEGKQRRGSNSSSIDQHSSDEEIDDELYADGSRTGVKMSKLCMCVSMGLCRRKSRYQVEPDDEADSGLESSDHIDNKDREYTDSIGNGTGNKIDNNKPKRAKSAQKLLEAEDATLMDDVDITRHPRDCMCGCRKIVDLFDTAS
jgi:hypothetical protein